MNIAIIAHDSKKELMVQFCIAYCGILSRHNICATGTTGKLVSEATGLNIQRFLSGSQGGDQQIAARIACNEIDMLLFFRDPLEPQAPRTQRDESASAVRRAQHSAGHQHRHGGGFDPRPGARRFGLAHHCQPRILIALFAVMRTEYTQPPPTERAAPAESGPGDRLGGRQPRSVPCKTRTYPLR